MRTRCLGAYRHLRLSRADRGMLVAEFHRIGQDRPPSSMDSRLRRSDYAGPETSRWNCNEAAQDNSGALADEDTDDSSFDFYAGIASAIGVLLVLIVAVVTAASLWVLVQR
jgi:hypothetical protein